MISAEKEARLLEISKATLQEVQSRFFNGYNRVLVVRPTGFGKSYMLANLTSTMDQGDLRYKKCLYIYPTNVIRDDVIKTYATNEKFKESCKQYRWKNKKRTTDERVGMLNDNTDFYSYDYLTNRAKDIKNGDMTRTQFRDFIKQYDLIMLDECHRVGADGFQDAFDIFKSCISMDTNLVGVTATPYRLDDIAITEVFGQKNQISKYTLSDAIKEGLLSKFDYIYAVSDNDDYISSAVDTISELRGKRSRNSVSVSEVEELEKCMHMINVGHILKNHLKLPLQPGETEEHVGSNNYAKFVIFMNNRAHIHEYADTVAGWFKEAYPTMNINNHVVISKSLRDKPYIIQGQQIEIEDTDELSNIDIQDNTIDLIFCVDKLNMGYHVESITGVILVGNTESASKYNQQIGRCFSVRSENKPIIIDIVNKFELSPSVQKWSEYKKKEGKGVKVNLPDILNKNCVDSYDYTEEIAKLARKIIDNKFDKQESICWMYTERFMPATVIATSLNITLETVLKVLINNKIQIVDIDDIAKHKDLLTDKVIERLGI